MRARPPPPPARDLAPVSAADFVRITDHAPQTDPIDSPSQDGTVSVLTYIPNEARWARSVMQALGAWGVRGMSRGGGQKSADKLQVRSLRAWAESTSEVLTLRRISVR